MPFIEPESTAGKKRKRVDATERSKKEKRTESSNITLRESQILESRQHYNNIVDILRIAKDTKRAADRSEALLALCRVFCRLIAGGDMTSSKGTPKSELTIIEWLKKQFKDYSDVLLDTVASKTRDDVDAIALLMQLIKAETTSSVNSVDRPWTSGTFATLVGTLLRLTRLKDERAAFVHSYVNDYDDVRYYFLHVVSRILDEAQDSGSEDQLQQNALDMLSGIEGIPGSDEELENFFGGAPEQKKHKLMSLSAHKKVAESAWLALLRTSLDKDQRKTVLRVMTDRIVPWFNRPELLMDFLTDSYDLGGATSLLALSGLFHLMQEKNLDYPSFFSKLYSLLDHNLLHSKHRSRFFRLLNTFMSSTHLPAALVASFIKRLARLALHGPPAGI
ncbi:hypothetical protein LTS18_012422, partial [Coniosporium uncinatum]